LLRLKKHIVTEIIKVFLAVILALILSMVSFQFARLLAKAVEGKIVGSAIYKLVVLQAIDLFVLLTPFAFFIATLICLNKLARDHELVAMKSVGYSDAKIYQAILIFALPLALLVAFITLAVLPNTFLLKHKITEQAKKESELSIIQPGNFRTIGGNITVFVGQVDKEKFGRFVFWQRHRGQHSVTIAEQGRQITKNDRRYLELINGSRYNISQDKSSQLLFFKRMLALLPIAEGAQRQRLQDVATHDLLKDSTPSHRIEFQRRLSPAIAIILLAIFAPFLIQLNPRDNRYGKFVIAILIYAIYSNSQHVYQALVENGSWPIFPGIYSAHLFFLLMMAVWMGLRYNASRPRGLEKKQRSEC